MSQIPLELQLQVVVSNLTEVLGIRFSGRIESTLSCRPVSAGLKGLVLRKPAHDAFDLVARLVGFLHLVGELPHPGNLWVRLRYGLSL